MTPSQRLSIVRDSLRQWLADHGVGDPEQNQPQSEAMLICGGYFCGRRFRFPNHTAVWFIEEDEVKVHDASGSLCECYRGDQIDTLAGQWVQQSQQEPLQDEPRLRISAPSLSGGDAAAEGRSSEAVPARRAA